MVAAVTALCSCHGAPGPNLASPGPVVGTPVPFEVLVQTDGWTNLSADRLAITTPQEWKEFWMGCYRPGGGPVRPEVDFSTHLVIAAAMGIRTTGGYSIEIKELVERDGKLLAQVTETSPGSGCAVTQSVTAPATAILVERHDVDVDFIERKTETDCP